MPSGFAYRASLSEFGIRVEIESKSEKAIAIATECISRGNQTQFSNAGDQTIYIVLAANNVNQPPACRRERIDSTALNLNFGYVAVRADPLTGHGACEFPPGAEFGEP